MTKPIGDDLKLIGKIGIWYLLGFLMYSISDNAEQLIFIKKSKPKKRGVRGRQNSPHKISF